MTLRTNVQPSYACTLAHTHKLIILLCKLFIHHSNLQLLPICLVFVSNKIIDRGSNTTSRQVNLRLICNLSFVICVQGKMWLQKIFDSGRKTIGRNQSQSWQVYPPDSSHIAATRSAARFFRAPHNQASSCPERRPSRRDIIFFPAWCRSTRISSRTTSLAWKHAC